MHQQLFFNHKICEIVKWAILQKGVGSTFLSLMLLYFLLRLDIIQSTYLALYQHSTVERLIEACVDGAHTQLKTLPFSCGQDCELPRRGLSRILADDTRKDL